MQVLSSPSRQNVDYSHRRGLWMDIGIFSTRNLAYISGKRKILWWIIGLSSVPLHLFYNSSFFAVIVYYEYSAEFVEYNSLRFDALNATETLANLSVSDWRNAYGALYPSAYGNTYLILDNISLDINDYQSFAAENYSLPSLPMPLVDESFFANNSNTLVSESGWMPGKAISSTVPPNSELHIRFAFADLQANESKLQISLYFMLTVITWNIIKVFAMVSVLLDTRDDYLVTLGDAVASFLQRADPTTEGLCTLAREEMLWKTGNLKHISEDDYRRGKLELRANGLWTGRQRRYISSIGVHRRMFGTFFLFGAALGGILGLALTPGLPWQDAWGTASTTAFSITNDSFGATGTLLNAWMSNFPQLLVSLCYLAINGLVTCMALAHEWNQLALNRKFLRVTTPQGEQRSSYFLQLPFKWAVPLTATSCILHWLTSQTFFLIRFDAMDSSGRWVRSDSLSACGVSKASGLALVLLFTALVLAVSVISTLRFETHIPFAASCSLVISAACHPPPDQLDPHLGCVRWGVVNNHQVIDGVEHCSFSVEATRRPKDGAKYA